MKTIVTAFVSLVLLSMLATGCNRQKEPTVSLLNGRFITTSVEVSPAAVLKFKWRAEKGKSDLASFTIQQNGEDLYGFPDNSIEPDVHIDSAYMEGPAATGDYTYAFIATDADGNLGEKSIVVTVAD
jgi:uncharacterized protein YdeI (BOF family)